MEKDDEILGVGNSYSTVFRQYDPRIGRWKTVDPKASIMPFASPYLAMDNRPTITNDPNGDCPSCFSGAVAGIISEFVVQVADGMFFKGYDFETAIKQVDKTDILVSGASGFITGAFTGGLDKIAHLFKGRYAKVTYRLLGEINEYVGDFLENSGKKAFNGEEYSLTDALTDAGYNKAASLVGTPNSRFDLEDSKNILVRKSKQFEQKVERAAAAKNNSEKFSKLAQKAKDDKLKAKYQNQADKWNNKFERRAQDAENMTLSTFNEIIGGDMKHEMKKDLIDKTRSRIKDKVNSMKNNIEVGPLQEIRDDEIIE